MIYTATELENWFKRIAFSRIVQKKSGNNRYAGDAGYWDGGRCNYGAAHNLQEDCQRLAKFFTNIVELRNSRKELMSFNNQEEFEKNKQNLLSKTTNAINGLNMKTSNNTSIGGVCIIWADFADNFNSIVDNFRKDLELLKKNIESVPYNEIKELQKLLSDERKLQKEIEENERKARNEPDPDKKKKFLFFANEAKDKWKKILARKKELKSSRLGDDFNPDSHIDNFLQAVENKLTGKNKPARPNRPSTNTNNSNSNNFSSPNSPNNSSPLTNNHQEKPFFQNYWKELILASAFLTGVYYIYHQDYEKTN